MLTKLLQSPCSGELFEHFEQCLDITHCFTCCSTTVWTVFGHAILPFHVFKQCSNSLPCGDVLFEHCLNSLSLFGNVRTLRTVFGHVILPFHAFKQCSNSLSLFGNVRTLFESVQTSRTALRAVRTLFRQCSDILYSLSMCSNSAQTARRALVCCSNTVQTICPCLAMFEHFKQCSNCMLMPTTCGESFLFLFSFSSSLFFCLQPFTSARKRIHTCPSATRPHAHPPALKTSESFLFLFFSFFLSFFTVIRFCTPICTPIRMLGTN